MLRNAKQHNPDDAAYLSLWRGESLIGHFRCAVPGLEYPVHTRLTTERKSSHMLLSDGSWQQWAKGAAVALLAFGGLGTVSALWNNPLFVRMTPAGGWEIGLLSALSVLFGLYVAIRRPACADRTAGVGGVLGFLGVACPVCNKILLLIFGGELLLTYFEPVRLYVAAAGTAILAVAVMLEKRRSRSLPGAPEPMTPPASREAV